MGKAHSSCQCIIEENDCMEQKQQLNRQRHPSNPCLFEKRKDWLVYFSSHYLCSFHFWLPDIIFVAGHVCVGCNTVQANWLQTISQELDTPYRCRQCLKDNSRPSHFFTDGPYFFLCTIYPNQPTSFPFPSHIQNIQPHPTSFPFFFKLPSPLSAS